MEDSAKSSVPLGGSHDSELSVPQTYSESRPRAGPYPSDDRLVYLVSGPGNGLPPYRVAIAPVPDGEWKITTIGGVLELDRRMYGIVMLQPASVLIATSKFIPGKAFGHTLGPTTDHGIYSWILVELHGAAPKPNKFLLPGGFGDTFVVTDIGEPVPDSKVWVVTSKTGNHVGQIVSRRGEEEWVIQMDVTLGMYGVYWNSVSVSNSS
jgi:hypothetical protein